MNNNNQQIQEEGGLEVVAIAMLLGALALGACLWGGAQLASLIWSQSLLETDSTTLVKTLFETLADHRGDPAQAWPEPERSKLPPVWLYWPCTLISFAVLMFMGSRLWRVFSYDPNNLDEVKRFGVKKHAEEATEDDIKHLVIKRPTPGRFPLGRVGNKVLASERNGSHRGKRQIAGSISLFGPSQSGKSTHSMEGLAWWRGPAIVVSVKPDLALETIEQRARYGEVKIFDPAGVHQAKGHIATWNPLDHSKTWVDAWRMAKRLIEATANNDSSTGRFWSTNSVSVLAAFLSLAQITGKTMSDVSRWVIGMDQPTDDDPGEVASYIKAIGHTDGLDERRVDGISTTLRGVWSSDSRMNSSYFVSMKASVEAWSRDEVDAATCTTSIDLDWLVSGDNTLYITAPLVDQTLLAPVIGGLIATLVDDVMLWHQITGKKLDPQMLVLLDEAANMQLPQLPDWSSTVTGLGVQLVTIWQSYSQIRNSYGENANTILDNSRSTIWFPGIKDKESTRYIEMLLGNEYQESRISSLPARTRGGVNNDSLAPPNVLRQMDPGDHLIITGTTAPIHAQALRQPKRWWDRFHTAR